MTGEPFVFGGLAASIYMKGKSTRSRPVIRLHGVDCLSCHDCLGIKPASEFAVFGSGQSDPYCRSCRNERQARNRAKKKTAR